MIRDRETIHKELQKFLDTLQNIAKEDGIITDDEMKIINSVESGIKDLEEQVFQILSDDLDDADFKDLTSEILESLIYNARQTALEDDVISEDESRLLEKIQELKDQEVFS